MPFSPYLLDSPLKQAERALRRPSSALWLRAVCVRTSRFEESLQFYVATLGLTLARVGAHPISGSSRAWLVDAEGVEVLELLEVPDGDDPGVHELVFGMPRRTVTLLRSRLELQGIAHTKAGESVYFKDPCGTTVRVDAL